MARGAKPRDRQGFRTDDQGAVRGNAGDGAEQLGLGNRGGDLRDVPIDRANERPEPGDHAEVAPHQRPLLQPEVRPRLGAHPLPTRAGEQLAPLEMQPAHVQLRVDAIDERRPLRDERRPMANERRPLALRKRRGIHLGDEPGETHPREQLGVDIIPFVVRLRNRPEPARMREDEVPARPLEQLVQPRPRRAGLP